MKKHMSFILAAAVLSLLIASCGAKPAEKADPMLVYTQAAETVSFQLTSTALFLPAATETPVPTSTPEATATEVPATATQPAVQPTVVAQPVQPPTATPVIQQSGDAARWDSQSPVDGTSMGTGVEFQFMVSMLNTGSTTWTNKYQMTYTGGTSLSGATAFPCSRASTKPGEKCDFYLAAKSPMDPGKHTARYWLVNAQGVKIPGGEVYFNFEVK